MKIKISPQVTNKLAKTGRNIVKNMQDPDALMPIILLESTVTGGRTYQAYKRGGIEEARERGFEETLGAIFWLGGIKAFNKMGDKIGKSLMKLKDIDFDVAKDNVRDPFTKFAKTVADKGITKNKLTAFKVAKVVSSVVLANAFVGFVVPKINHAMTNYFKGNKSNPEIKTSVAGSNNPTAPAPTQPSNAMLGAALPAKDTVSSDDEATNQRLTIDSFVSKTNSKTTKNTKDKTSFTGLNLTQMALAGADLLENNERVKLISTDAGIAGGRAVNARNKYERAEILFRDLSSIYFYMFCRNHINQALNYIEDGKPNRLDPTSVQNVSDHINSKIGNSSIKPDNFKAIMLGKEKVEIPKEIKFENDIVSLKDFFKAETDVNTRQIAAEMSKLQPKTDVGRILTKDQVEDVYRGGAINEPKFLRKLYFDATNGATEKETKFVSQGRLKEIKKNVIDYVDSMCNNATKKGVDISQDIVKKANKANLWKTGINLGIGFAVSSLFLSTLIPKAQYLMTKMRTGHDKFPGTDEELTTKTHHSKG